MSRPILGCALLLSCFVGCRTRLLDGGQPAATPPASPPWPLAAHDPQLSNRGSTIGPNVAGVVWRSPDFDLGAGCEIAQPLVARDGTIDVIGGDGSVRAFAPEDGKLRFTTSLSFPLETATGALGADGTIYVGALVPFGATPIIALDPATGARRWTSMVCRASLGFVGGDGNIYGVCWFDGAGAGTSVFSLRPSDGGLRFRSDAPEGTQLLLQGVDGTLIALLQQNTGATFDPRDGSLLRQLDLASDIDSCLEVSTAGVLHCHSLAADTLEALDIASGAPIWSASDQFIPGATVWAEGNEGRLYLIQQDHIGVYDAAGNVTNFAPTTPVSGGAVPSLLLDADGAAYLYSNTDQGTSLSAYDATGASRFVSALDDNGWIGASTLALSDGTLYGVTCRQQANGCGTSPCHLVAFGTRR